jgi:hypothetical protein
LGLDRGDVDQSHLEEAALRIVAVLGQPAPVVCTLIVQQGRGHYAASAAVVSPGGVLDLLDPLRRAADTFAGALVALGRSGQPTLELGDEDRRGGAREAAVALRAGTGGRAVRFPGQEALVGRVRAADVPRLSAIAALSPIGTVLEPDTVLETRDFVRPTFAGGVLRLAVVPAAGGTVAPHERQHVHDCGRDH